MVSAFVLYGWLRCCCCTHFFLSLLPVVFVFSIWFSMVVLSWIRLNFNRTLKEFKWDEYRHTHTPTKNRRDKAPEDKPMLALIHFTSALIIKTIDPVNNKVKTWNGKKNCDYEILNQPNNAHRKRAKRSKTHQIKCAMISIRIRIVIMMAWLNIIVISVDLRLFYWVAFFLPFLGYNFNRSFQ